VVIVGGGFEDEVEGGVEEGGGVFPDLVVNEGNQGIGLELGIGSAMG
jgi:hypothetical protein